MKMRVLARVMPAAASLLLGGCIRNVIVHEFRDPELRLRATVVPELVATQPSRAPLQNFEVNIDVTAPKDSALMLVLDRDVAYSRLEPYLGEAGVRFMRETQADWVHDGDDKLAPAILRVTLRDTNDLVRRLEALRYSTQKRTRSLLGNNFVNDSVIGAPWLLVVRRGTATRIRMLAVLAGSDAVEHALYQVRYQWIAVPDSDPLPESCAKRPIFVSDRANDECARVVSAGATARRLEAYTHLIHENGWVITGVGFGLATAVALISRP